LKYATPFSRFLLIRHSVSNTFQAYLERVTLITK